MFLKILVFSFVGIFILGCGGASPQKSKVIKVQQTTNLVQIVENPYILKSSIKLVAITNYLIKKDLHVDKPNFPSKPTKPKLPHAKNLTKGKYEKTKSFEQRVANEKTKRVEKIRAIEKKYAKDVKNYNAEVKRLTDNYNNSLAKKQKNIASITTKAMAKAYATVYGKPYLVNSLKYDADAEIFYGVVKSTQGDFSESVSIKVPINKAEEFEKNLASLKTKVVFDYTNNKLSLKNISIKEKKNSYIAQLNSNTYEPQNISVAINDGSLNLPNAPLLSSSLAINENDYNIGNINYSKDPEIAALQKKQFELQKKAKVKRNSAKKEQELKKQKEALEAQIALLEQKSGGYNDIPKLLKKVKTKKVDKTKWLFIVAIENYEYTDPVAYSKTSAKSFKSVAQKRLGISEKNTLTLINTGATSGKIRHKLKSMLAHVKKGDTIYFYYSGHGIPVPAQENAPYLLAQDMSPEYVADDERFKLQNIYNSLSNSKASKVVAFVDSCFSGGTDNQQLIKGVAATRVKPKKVSFDKNKMIVISAGSKTQYSNKYDEKSNRLFSYYVMRGLIKNNANTSRLYDYVKSNVAEKSYEMGASYEQVPVYDGNLEMGL